MFVRANSRFITLKKPKFGDDVVIERIRFPEVFGQCLIPICVQSPGVLLGIESRV